MLDMSFDDLPDLNQTFQISQTLCSLMTANNNSGGFRSWKVEMEPENCVHLLFTFTLVFGWELQGSCLSRLKAFQINKCIECKFTVTYMRENPLNLYKPIILEFKLNHL